MGNTAETPTQAAGIFTLGQPAFLHTRTGRWVTVGAAFMALTTATNTGAVGGDPWLAAACSGLFLPAFHGGIISWENVSVRHCAAIFAIAVAFSGVSGGVTNYNRNIIMTRESIRTLPEMDPDMRVMTTAKEHFCGKQTTGWIEAEGQKLNCGN